MKLTDKLTLTCEDNMQLMSRYPDGYFDLAIVDPPYGIGINSECMGGRKTVKPNKNKTWDNEVPTAEYFNELFRVSKNQIIWGGNYFNLPVSRYFAVWDKGETMYGRDFAECEFAWAGSGGTRIYKLNPVQLDRFHPTQKPVALYKWLLHKYAKPNDKILDTHLGSMSIAIACHDYGFELTGCELDPKYYEQGIKRVQNHLLQTKLF
jgi:site-specific DNA-methyltransferase (adenine-specific)